MLALLCVVLAVTAAAERNSAFQVRELADDDYLRSPPSFDSRLEEGRIWSDLLKVRRRSVD